MQDSFSTAELTSICYRHSNTSSCIAGQDQRSAVAIFLTCMSVRVCRPKLLKKSLSKSCFRRPPHFFLGLHRGYHPRETAAQMQCRCGGQRRRRRRELGTCSARTHVGVNIDPGPTHAGKPLPSPTAKRTEATVCLAADADACF